MVHISTSFRTKNEFCLGEKTYPKGSSPNNTPLPQDCPIQTAPVSLMGTMIPDAPWGLTPWAWLSCRRRVWERHGGESYLLAFDLTLLGESVDAKVTLCRCKQVSIS